LLHSHDHEELYESIFSVNVKGLLFYRAEGVALMPDGASIVLNASIVGSKGLLQTASMPPPRRRCAHCAHMDDGLEESPHRVNAVSPGSTDTPGLSRAAGFE